MTPAERRSLKEQLENATGWVCDVELSPDGKESFLLALRTKHGDIGISCGTFPQFVALAKAIDAGLRLDGTLSTRNDPKPVTPTQQAEIDSAREKAYEARVKGYEGECCTKCGKMTMVRRGNCLCCDTCGESSSCS
jgi:hypothetical protein